MFLDPQEHFKIQHFAAGAGVAAALRIWPWYNHGWFAVLLGVALIGAAYELLEWYDARLTKKLGQAGFGFSWFDVISDVAGAASLLVVTRIL